MKRIAIIGSGIGGTAAAYYLNKRGFNITLFEAGSYFGGHTNTVDIKVDNETYPIDTGFLVHNDRTYPNLIKFFSELEIETHPSEMSFSVKRTTDNITWAGTNLRSLFAQPKNLVSPRFYKFIYEILKFNINAKDYLVESERNIDLSLGELLDSKSYSNDFKNWYLLPMGGCIWSTPTDQMLKFPAHSFFRFCMNHGLLQITNRPQWKTVKNGCRTYVKKAIDKIENKFLNEPVLEVTPVSNKVKVKTTKREDIFDYCIIATHPPQTLNILKSSNEKAFDLLSKFKYQKNVALLHFDESLLPKEKIAYSAWNYLSNKEDDGSDSIAVSYLINKLQPLPFDQSVIVTLNPPPSITIKNVVEKIDYEHPVFDVEAVKAQKQMEEVQGVDNIYYSGAWLRYGFHEDGIWSALNVVERILRKEN